MKLRVRRPPIRVPGFRFAGVHCGLKGRDKRDVALIVSECPAVAVGAFTTNRVRAAPVVIAEERLRAGRAQAILVNSGNANACTGPSGRAVALEMTALAARRLGIPAAMVLPSSTGRIGVPLPRAKVRRGVLAACQALSAEGFHAALDGMMTTDAFPKFAVETVTIDDVAVNIAGLAKGAGMIAPHMATLLAYILTDAAVSRAALRRVLGAALPESFNSIVVDGDMSTNDTVLLLANGVAGNPRLTLRSPGLSVLGEAMTRIMRKLARDMVRDGEGATRLVDIVVRGARTVRDAERVADTIARSPLCKTAFYGGDPYAGRILCAAGYSGARFDADKIDLFVGDVQIVRAGVERTARVERRASHVVTRAEFTLTVDLHAGEKSARRTTSDLSSAYVRFNSDYQT